VREHEKERCIERCCFLSGSQESPEFRLRHRPDVSDAVRHRQLVRASALPPAEVQRRIREKDRVVDGVRKHH